MLIVRISAIGDTILAARTHAIARHKGYAPYLLTHLSNASLLHCMPQLAGACLSSDNGLSFLLRSAESGEMLPVDGKTFSSAIGEDLSHQQNAAEKQLRRILNVVDLQATRRSRRAIAKLEQLMTGQGISVNIHTVHKLTLWRIVLVVWSFFARRQFHGRVPPAWLQNRLKPVHELQSKVMGKLPDIGSHREGLAELPVLTMPSASSTNKNAQPYVVFLLGSSYRLKSWPREYFRALIEQILNHTELQIVLCGGKDDRTAGEYLEFAHQDRIRNLTGATSLAETLTWIAGAKYVVTGDSFASHAADLLGTPASVLFGSTHPLLGFAPKGTHTTVHHSGLSCSPCSRHGQGECRFKNLRCLTSIKPEQVFSKIEHSLNISCQNHDNRAPLV
jgi:heptosyltransferase-2